jgi:thiopurine S-methyltransferase
MEETELVHFIIIVCTTTGNSMEPEFWHQRWQENKIGFHLNEVNPYLVDHWQDLGVLPGARVFVPLCGKTLDMRWLAEQGYLVEAVEVSEIAIEQFFTEQGIAFERQTSGDWITYQADSIRIWCGDFFKLPPQQIASPKLGPIEAIYDRAALIALPEVMRSTYVRKLLEITGVVPQLLITLEYDQSQMTGPPFSVSPKEVSELYRDSYGEIPGPIKRTDVLAEEARFAERGLGELFENIYLLQVPKK